MKKIIIALSLIVLATCNISAQNNSHKENPRKFSHEQFRAKQKSHIIEKANLTPEEADAFFPLFFELQKEKFRIEREARSKVIKERGQKLTDEQWKELLSNTADAKISIAKLEKEYITKYLQVVSPKKLIDIQRAEHTFQSYMIKSMTRGGEKKAQHHKKEE